MDVMRTTEMPPRRRKWTLEEYERFVDLGVIRPDERVELIDGEIVEKKAPQKSAHATAVQLVEEALRAAIPAGFSVRVQLPLALPPDSEPEPDVAVVPGRPRDYRDAHPREAVLVVEVSDMTLRDDRRTKAGLYARAVIPEYWIINLPDRLVEVHREPSAVADEPFGHRYRSVQRLGPESSVTPIGSPLSVRVDDLLP